MFMAGTYNFMLLMCSFKSHTRPRHVCTFSWFKIICHYFSHANSCETL